MKWQDVEGWFSEEDAEALGTLMLEVPEGGATAHVGILCGRHLAAMAPIIKGRNLSVVAIDTWAGSDGGIYAREEDGHFVNVVRSWPLVAIMFGRTTCEFDFGGMIEIVPSSSLCAAGRARTLGQTFDLIFLDADHLYEHVLADIMAWDPLLRPGGILCGHDYGEKSHDGVQKAVKVLDSIYLPGGTIWAWRKP